MLNSSLTLPLILLKASLCMATFAQHASVTPHCLQNKAVTPQPVFPNEDLAISTTSFSTVPYLGPPPPSHPKCLCLPASYALTVPLEVCFLLSFLLHSQIAKTGYFFLTLLKGYILQPCPALLQWGAFFLVMNLFSTLDSYGSAGYLLYWLRPWVLKSHKPDLLLLFHNSTNWCLDCSLVRP